MNRLFIDLYLDEDVDVLVGQLIRAYGFDALSTLDAGQLGHTDEEQLAHAVSLERVMLTHHRTHFEALAFRRLAANIVREFGKAGKSGLNSHLVCAISAATFRRETDDRRFEVTF
ncbi:MAG: DUF5615 family PIN-like protein [Pirellulales bacterium]|nr:DUF5615 family PIN-like protein [Pirellulales bacterium]